MDVVVDTNIVFSAVLNSNGKIGDLLFNLDSSVSFYSCHYLLAEINRHKPKLLKIARQMTESQLDVAILLVMNQLTFVDEHSIDPVIRERATHLVSDVDPFDVDFVALTIQLKAILWTGDKVLYAGLRQKGYMSICTTDELRDLCGR